MTQTLGTTARDGRPRWGRRLLARSLDALLAVALSAVVIWPSAWSSALDALTAAGFDSVRDFVQAWDAGDATGGAAARAADSLQPVVLGAVLLQTVVIWLYETLSTTLVSTTPGKAFTRLRVHVDHGDDPQRSGPHRSWVTRLIRMGLRAALVVVPPALALGMLVAGFLGADGAAGVAEVAIAASAVLGLLALVGDGVHGVLTGTRVVEFSWAELRGQAERYATDDEHLRRLREAADQSAGARRARERLEAQPGYAQARRGISQAQGTRGRPEELLAQGRQALAAQGVQVSDARAQQASQAVDSFLAKARRSR